MNENQPIECRAAVDIAAKTSSNEILFLPVGIHAITPVSGGIGRPIHVKVTPDTAAAVQRQYSALTAKGKRPYFDFNHEDGPASFWPESFIWRASEGVIARGEWSRRGKSAVEGKDFRAFSPVFHVDNKRAEAALVVCNEKAEPNMGGLVNNPAFSNLPLWAKNAGAIPGETTQKEKQKMENEELAALRAKQQELESSVAALKAASATPENRETLSRSQVELRNIQLEIEASELRGEAERLKSDIRAKNQAFADEKITEAIKAGKILPKDYVTQEYWKTEITARPAVAERLKSMPGGNTSLSTRVVGLFNRGIEVVAEAPQAIYGALAKTVSRMNKTRVLTEKMALSRDLHALYAAEFSPMTAKDPLRAAAYPPALWDEAIQASDVTDTDWGTMAGTLVSQRTLELLKFTFPALSAFTTDFSDQSATFNQTIMTRTVSIPSVVSYNTSTGWADSTPDTNDVPITITAHRGVQIGINENVQAETVRRLFNEIAPAQAYAIGKDFMDALYANITDANFTNNSVSTLANFNRNAVIDMATQLNLQGVPMGPNMRFLLLYSTYFGALQKDTAIPSGIVQLGAYQEPRIITAPEANAAFVINVSNFQVYDAMNMPTNNGNVVGFAGSKSALVIATRVPNDYSSIFPGATGGGVVQLITNPDIGITVMLVQYVDHKLGKSAQRIALMYGTAAGQGAAGRLLKAATGSGSSQS